MLRVVPRIWLAAYKMGSEDLPGRFREPINCNVDSGNPRRGVRNRDFAPPADLGRGAAALVHHVARHVVLDIDVTITVVLDIDDADHVRRLDDRRLAPRGRPCAGADRHIGGCPRRDRAPAGSVGARYTY